MYSSGLIVFAKPPVLGQVKSRLAKSIGDKQALEIYQFLLKYTKQVIDELIKLQSCRVLVYWDSFIPENSVFSNSYEERIQVEGNLGSKLTEAFRDFSSEQENLCVIGTDCPFLTSSILAEAFQALGSGKSCIGPALDGGYYLIGLKNPNAYWFEGIPWSTSEVFQRTIDKFTEKSEPFHLLPTLRDVDTIEDWKFFQSTI